MGQFEAMSMPDSRSFLQELDDAIAKGSAESRLRALWHATDLLIAGRYSDSEIWIFGEVIGRLAEEIEVAARAQLAKRLAHADNAPKSVVRKLAFDDSIAVAGPVLQHSGRLDAEVLVANIRTKSQDHLLAISKRKTLGHSVTDELVTRGNQEVLNSVAINNGARRHFALIAFMGLSGCPRSRRSCSGIEPGNLPTWAPPANIGDGSR
jgi:uncharacterized protein (DUF2336 family)